VGAIPGHNSASGWFFPFWTYITGWFMRFPGQLAAMERYVFPFCVSPSVLCEVFKIMVVLSTPHRVSIAGFAVNPPVFEGVEAYPIKLSSKKKNAPQRLYEPL